MGLSILTYGIRVWFSMDKARQRQSDNIVESLDRARARIETLEAENATLHDEMNTLKATASNSLAHAEGLRIELEWREKQVARQTAEIGQLHVLVGQLQAQLAAQGGGK